MLTTIILSIILGIAIAVVVSDKFSAPIDLASIVVIMFGAAYLLVHIVHWVPVEYDFNKFVVKRTAFEQTLNAARESDRDWEVAAIVRDVADWNIELAEMQYENKNWFLEQYIDDRVDELKPIQ